MTKAQLRPDFYHSARILLLALLLCLPEVLVAQRALSPQPFGRAVATSGTTQDNFRTLQKKFPGFFYFPQSVNPQVTTAPQSGNAPVVRTEPLYTDEQTGTQLIGAVLYSSDFSAYSDYNFYSFPVTSPVTFTKYSNVSTGLQPNGGGLFSSDGLTFDYIQYMSFGTTIYMYYYKYDTQNWETLAGHSVSDQTMLAYDLTRDPVTQIPYGVYMTQAGQELGTPDYSGEVPTRSTIGALSHELVTLAADQQGNLYGIGTDGVLYQVDKTNASLTSLGSTGVVPADAQQSAVVDPKTGKMYWAAVLADQTTGLYVVDLPSPTAQLIERFSSTKQIVCLNMKPSEIPADAPAAVENLQSQFEGSSLDGTITFTLPEKTYGGDDLTGNITYHVLINGREDISVDDAAPGEEVTEDISLKGGNNQIQVYCSNDAGDGPKGSGITLWAGDDVPTAPTNVVLTKTGDNALTLTWTAPTSGVHNGYMNPADTRYDVTRFPDSVRVATGITETTITDKVSPAHVTPYKYKVTARGVNGEGGSAVSNRIKLGAAFTTPYRNDIASEEDFELFDIYDLNNDGNTWTFEGYEARYRSNSNTGNDLLVAPAVSLKNDRLYNVSFLYRTMGDPEILGVTYGPADQTPAGYTLKLLNDTTLTNRGIKTYEKQIRVADNGDYAFSFAAKSTSAGWHLDVRKFSVVDGPLLIAPDSVANLSVVAAARGELKSTLTFDAPTKTVDGKALTSLSKIEVKDADGRLVGAINNPAVGQKGLAITDNNPANGFNTYTVTAFNADGGAGFAATCRVFVGVDTPVAPSGVTAREGDDGNVTVSWQAPAEGENGGYIDATALTYNVQRAMSGTRTVVASGINETSQSDNISQTGDQTMYLYYVSAMNDQGESRYATSNSMIAGAPYSYPFKESFPNGVMEHKFLTANHSDMLNWPSQSADGDGGCIEMMGADFPSYNTEYFETGKISLEGATRPGLVYSYYEQPGNGRLFVMVYGNNTGWKTVDNIDFSKVSAGTAQWVTHTILLDDFTNDKYVRLRFFYYNDKVNDCMIDNINVRDVLSKNISLGKLSVPSSVKAGYNSQVQVNVSNTGTDEVSNIRLDLLVNGRKQDSLAIASLSINADTTVTIPTKFLSGDKGDAIVRVLATADGDAIESDNAVEDTTNVSVVDFPTTSLTGEIRDGKAHLTWIEPTLGNYAPAFTDDVESYTPWAIENIGDWTTYDGDEAASYTIPNSQVQFPHAGTAFAAIVFRPYTIFARSEKNPYTHSGDQCFAMFDAQAAEATGTNGYTDDYLISPRLSGNKQTITFWARSITTTDYEEVFDVLYSTTDSLHTSLTGVALQDAKESTGKWHEYSVELPEGTTFFAIHLKSRDQFALFIDDITFEPAVEGGKVAVSGYNIYRDGKLVATVPASQKEYDDLVGGSYQVSVVYRQGESELSNAVSLLATGINTISQNGLSVDVNGGALTINGADGEAVTVYNTAGQIVRHAIARNGSAISLPAGLYLVKVGDKVFHVAVK